MKIALITTNLRGGGAEKTVLKLAAGLGGRGHEVHLLLLEHIVEHDLPPGLGLHALSAPGRARAKGFLGKRLTALALKRLVARLSAPGPFDLMVSTLPYADEVAALARLNPLWCRIPNTLSAELDLLSRGNPGKAARRRARYRRLYGLANLIAVSQGVAEDLRTRLGLTGANIVTIYNPFDLEDIRRQAQVPEPDLPEEPYILHIGRFAPQKRHDLLLAAWRAAGLPHRLVLLTRPEAGLERLVAASGAGDRVTIVGFRPNPYPWIAQADLLVLCSDHEGLPNVLIEALACGTRVVSTDCPSGPREVLTGELARFLVPCGDAAALAEAMQAALAAPRPEPGQGLAPFAADTVLQAYEALPARWRAPI